MKRSLTIALLCACSILYAQQTGYEPGVDRWSIKTSVIWGPAKKAALEKLMTLGSPISKYTEAKYGSARIKTPVNGLKEGDMITVKGWLQLIAVERDNEKHRDGDYHIQLRTASEWGDTCFIVEVPLPDFVQDKALHDSLVKVRQFIKHSLLKEKDPGTGGNVIKGAYVYVTGQLFFDAPHMKDLGKRGKKGMKSYTAWEIHPVVSMRFAPKKK
jgi:hypothetical protein